MASMRLPHSIIGSSQAVPICYFLFNWKFSNYSIVLQLSSSCLSKITPPYSTACVEPVVFLAPNMLLQKHEFVPNLFVFPPCSCWAAVWSSSSSPGKEKGSSGAAAATDCAQGVFPLQSMSLSVVSCPFTTGELNEEFCCVFIPHI